MAVDDEDGARHWIVEPPPATGEVSLYLAGADDVALTPEQEAALGALLASLEGDDKEVVGHRFDCPQESSCDALSCGKVSCTLICSGLVTKPPAIRGWSLTGSFKPRL